MSCQEGALDAYSNTQGPLFDREAALVAAEDHTAQKAFSLHGPPGPTCQQVDGGDGDGSGPRVDWHRLDRRQLGVHEHLKGCAVGGGGRVRGGGMTESPFACSSAWVSCRSPRM